jgi:hypothetical protein
LNHLELHYREGMPCDIEMHLFVVQIRTDKKEKVITVLNKFDSFAGPVELPESEIDYRDKLKVGKRNVFYIPLDLAEKVGLVG